MLDNGFDFYARLAARSKNGLPDPVLFDVNQVPQGPAQRLPGRLAHRRPTPPARSTPAWARRPAPSPPPLYSYDPDIGRLAVTTPTYNTAVVAVNQNAFPYGGLDLARLFDGRRRSRPTSAAARPPRSASTSATSPAAAWPPRRPPARVWWRAPGRCS